MENQVEHEPMSGKRYQCRACINAIGESECAKFPNGKPMGTCKEEQSRWMQRLDIRCPCNDCVHYRGFAKCDAFHDGLPQDFDRTHDMRCPELWVVCNPKNGIGYMYTNTPWRYDGGEHENS